MKKALALLLTVLMLLGLVACGSASAPATDDKKSDAPAEESKAEEAPAEESKAEEGAENAEPAAFTVGIVTGTISQAEDEQRGAEAVVAEYGNADEGGMVRHLNYPDNYMKEQETTIQQIASLADDENLRVVVVNQGPPGTAAAFQQIKERIPECICMVGNSQEDPNLIESVADLVVDPDNVNRGYLIPLAAQKMGAKKFVHVSFPRHMSIELLQVRRDIFEATCKKIGLEFIAETAPDPMSDVGIPGAQQYILEKMPEWVEKYGKDTAFFATNDAQTEPMLKRVAELGAIFVEQDLPSPILGYPGAFGIDLKNEAGNWPAILKKVEEAVVEKGGKDRMGTWAFSFGYSTTQALAEYGKNIVEGKMEKGKLEDLLKCYEKYTPGAKWNGSVYVDRASAEARENHMLVYQDTYVLGKGFLNMTDVEVPDVFALMEEMKDK